MEKAKIILHAKEYLDQLSNGIDPLRKTIIEADSIVFQPQIQRCFAFISGILQELLDHGGYVALSETESKKYELVRKKAAFQLTDEKKREVLICREGITATGFLRNINRMIDNKCMEKLSAKSVNTWLQEYGLIKAEKKQTMINKTVWNLTDSAQEIGIAEQDVADPKTGEIKRQIVYSQQAQLFLLDHLEEISAKARSR